MSFNKLLSDTFSKADKNAWSQAASAEIKSNDPLQSLQWRTSDEIIFNPYYDSSDISPTLKQLQKFQLKETSNLYSSARFWFATAHITVKDEIIANTLALDQLKIEADGIIFQLEKTTINFESLLKNIEWNYCTVSFIISNNNQIHSLNDYIKKTYANAKLSGVFFWIDSTAIKEIIPIQNLKYGGLYIKSTSPVNEITDALLQGVKLIDRLDTSDVETAIHNIAFSLPVHNDFLIEISKLKALRILWYQVTQAYQIKNYRPEHLHIHTRSEVFKNKIYEPHGNMLSNTISTMAAIAGGSNEHSTFPEKESDQTLSRIAKNNSFILRDEAHFDKVTDPFAGSYTIESMVKELAESAWKKFQNSIQ